MAARAVERKAAVQKVLVLEMLRKHDGATSAELGKLMGTDRYMPARRLADLELEGRVRKGTIRHCRACGRACVTWMVAAG
jgi:hypothetical protein